MLYTKNAGRVTRCLAGYTALLSHFNDDQETMLSIQVDFLCVVILWISYFIKHSITKCGYIIMTYLCFNIMYKFYISNYYHMLASQTSQQPIATESNNT